MSFDFWRANIHIASICSTAIALLSAPGAIACEAGPNKVSYTISADLNENSQQIEGREVVTIRNKTCQSLDVLYFHVYPNAFRWEMDSTYAQEARRSESPESHFLKYGRGMWLKVGSVSQPDGDLKFAVEKELLTIHLGKKLDPEGEITLNIPFQTQLAPIAERSGVWDGNFAVAQWFPKLMVFDRDGWALKHNSGYHFVGEFYGDYGTYDVSITTGKELVLGATGHKIEETLLGNERKRTRFLAENVRDFSWVADAHFSEKILTVGKTKIHVLTRNPSTAVIGEYAEKAFRYFSSRIGEYPYEDYTVAETYYNGPMQYPQISFQLSWPSGFARWFDRDATRLLEAAIAHETAHQWFYEVVGNNEVVDAWLDEGFATYLENAYMADLFAGQEQSMLKLTSLVQITDKQISAIIWRLYEPDLTQPIQTPSYLFHDPMHFYSSVYYKAYLFLGQFEALIGRRKFDELLRDYFQQNKFRNVEPDDWYKAVRSHAGEEAESWFRNWMSTVSRSDYAISDLSSSQSADGSYLHRFRVSQLGNHNVPVDVELMDEAGEKIRVRAGISAAAHFVVMEVRTRAPLSQATVDPDKVAPDSDRFNNVPSFFPKVKVWPITTKTFPSDAIGVYPLPYASKRPGIGWEAGVFFGLTHYVDWTGDILATYDWRHSRMNYGAMAETIQPDFPIGWALNFESNQLINQGSFMAKKIFGPEVEHDPSGDLRAGFVYFGPISDDRHSEGLGFSYRFSDIKNGYNPRFSAKVANAFASNFQESGSFDRLSVELRSNLEILSWTRLSMRNFWGHTYGKGQRSALFDLQAASEGGMRFDNSHLSRFRFNQIFTSNFDLKLPMPYGTWVDALSIIHGPSWEWHLFADTSLQSSGPRQVVDAGIGTRFYFISEEFGKLGLNLDYVPYQNAVSNGDRWANPVFFVGLVSASR